MMTPLTAEHIKDFRDGKVAAAFDKLMASLVRDCIDRAGTKAARTLTLEFAVVPVVDQETGACEGAKVSARIKSKVPAYESAEVDCSVRKNGAILFNDMSEEDVDQRSLDEENPKFRGD